MLAGAQLAALCRFAVAEARQPLAVGAGIRVRLREAAERAVGQCLFLFSSRRRHTSYIGDWSSDVCSSDLLELSLASVHFSTNRLELAEWLNGGRDVKWASLADGEQGVLSVRYADAFFPDLRDSVRTYNTIASKIYRELSEFVHGNHKTWGVTTDQIEFNEDAHARWLSNFADASTTVVYALCLRFLKELRQIGSER